MGDRSLSDYFDAEPLAADELRRGRALRMPCCLRSAEGDFADGPVSHLWVALSCERGDARPPAVRCLALVGGRLVRGVRAPRAALLARHFVELEPGRLWTVDEYSVCVPDECGRFVVTAGARRIAAGQATRRELRRAYGERISNASVDPRYPAWLDLDRAACRRLPVPEPGPLMSIVTPAFRTPARLLREMLASVLAQTYPRWELVLVNASPDDEGMRSVLDACDDPRVRVVDVEKNLGIVGNTNVGIAHATGDYVSFLDHDDLIEPHALAELVRAVADGGRPGLLYCDEDNVDEEGAPSLPLIKPDANPDFLLSNDYVLHWLTVRRDLLESVGRSGRDVEGAQDYDLTLRVFETGERVVRVPHVLYHWRICSGSSALDPGVKDYAQDAGAVAINAHLARTGRSGAARRADAYFTYRTTFAVGDRAPSIAVACAGELAPSLRAALSRYSSERGAEVRRVTVGERPDLLALARHAGADLVLLTTPAHDLDAAALETLVGYASRPGTLCASPRVVRADGLLDYAGMVARPDGSLGHLLRYLPHDDGGYVGRALRPYDAAVVNAECCLVSARELAALPLEGGFSTLGHALAEATLLGRASGLASVYLPHATARLVSPRSLVPDAPCEAELADSARLLALFPQIADGDPSQSPNFDPWSGYYRLRWPAGA